MALAVFLANESFVAGADRQVIKADEFDAIETAIDLIRQSELVAQRIRDKATREAQHAVEQARIKAEAQVQAHVARVVADAVANTARVLKGLEPALVDVVVGAVGRIVATADTTSLTRAAVAEVASRIGEQTFCVLKVSPNEVQSVREQMREFTAARSMPLTIEVEGNASLKPGSCEMLSAAGKLSVSIDQQLAALRDALEQSVIADMASVASSDVEPTEAQE